MQKAANKTINTVCQQKGPLVKHENCKFPKSFQGHLGMLVEPPSAQIFQVVCEMLISALIDQITNTYLANITWLRPKIFQ